MSNPSVFRSSLIRRAHAGTFPVCILILSAACQSTAGSRQFQGMIEPQLPHIYVEGGTGSVLPLRNLIQAGAEILASKGPEALIKQVALTTHGCEAAALQPGTYCLRIERDPHGNLSAQYTFAYDLPTKGQSPKLGYATLSAGPDAVNITANTEARGVDIDVTLTGQECAAYPSQRAREQGARRTTDVQCAALQAAYPDGVNITAGGISTFTDCVGGVPGNDKWGIERGNGTKCVYYQAIYGTPLYGWGRDQFNNTGLGAVEYLGVVDDDQPLRVTQTLNRIGDDWVADGHRKP
eukprot:jgi/Botrbrau1/21117/Bobra.0061s0012.1